MGILRTDKISGLEKPTAVTGSVYFDGTGDYLAVTPIDNSFVNWWLSDFTIEAWIYADSYADWYHDDGSYTIPVMVGHCDHNSNDNYWSFGPVEDGKVEFYYWKGSQNHTFITSSKVIAGEWSHIAMSYSVANGAKLFINGKGTDYISLSGTPQVNASTVEFNIGQYYNESLTGYVSNLRILNGTALYTSDFTPPTHELEVIGDTVLLCCNNPDSAGADGTGKTITANGNAAASTFSPGLTRDFTYGTEFKGVTTFDTQGYFVPPSGTTTERYPTGTGGAGAGTRGVVFGGYYPSSPNRSDVIDYVTIASTGNAVDFGDRLNTTDTCAACASATRALNAGGYNGSATINTIEYVTIASTGNASKFGELDLARRNRDGCSSSTRGLFGGGFPTDDAMEYVTIATSGTSSLFGNLTVSRYNLGALASPVRGVFGGGTPSTDTMDFVTIATTADAIDFGNLTAANGNVAGTSSETRGIFGFSNDVINYITIASTGDAIDFGDLNYNPNANACTSSLIRGIFMGGGSPTIVNTISYITIASTGNAVDFGDLTQARQSLSATSSGHGGLG